MAFVLALRVHAGLVNSALGLVNSDILVALKDKEPICFN